MRVALVLVLLVAACGDNIKPGAPLDAGVDTMVAVDAAPDGMGSVCGDGMITGDEQCETGACCTSCKFTVFNTECRAAAGECDVAEVCDGLAATCPADSKAPDGTTCGSGSFCTNGGCATCDTSVDADFDGSNQCLDCDDGNGLVFPKSAETACEGLDDDCDGEIDENYDVDSDTYSVCSDDPLVRDCNDNAATVHPNAPELCGTAGTGNGVDDNCNGYIDETCTPCDTTDNDGDGFTECQGDCNDTQVTVKPTASEVCDGFDTDCNSFTVDNCDVSDQCNWPGNPDVCKDDLECGCVLGTNGQCTGNYRCASFCEGSFTGPIGAGCTATQACMYRWLDSNNQHACAETMATLGSKLAGESCAQDNECRSGSCDQLCTGPNCMRCTDFCDHHQPGAAGSCATGTVCEIVAATGLSPFMYASCRVDDNGTRTTGQSCTGGCLWGPSSCVNNVCAQPCGANLHCPGGTHCSMRGNSVASGVWGAGLPTGVTGQPAMETVPVCLANSGAGSHDRPGGAACAQNGDCESQFCESTLHVCVDLCVSDLSCAIGLTCEPIYMRAKTGLTDGITWGRACVNASFGGFVQAL
jgi:hypothetical protein